MSSLEERVIEVIAKMKSNIGSHALYILWLEDAVEASERELNG